VRVMIDGEAVEVGEQGHVAWKGEVIGRVRKGTRLFSPPTHPGSRIAKYHKQVPCWYSESPEGRSVSWPTRKDAIRFLISQKG
jgi:hypothetical protein